MHIVHCTCNGSTVYRKNSSTKNICDMYRAQSSCVIVIIAPLQCTLRCNVLMQWLDFQTHSNQIRMEELRLTYEYRVVVNIGVRCEAYLISLPYPIFHTPYSTMKRQPPTQKLQRIHNKIVHCTVYM